MRWLVLVVLAAALPLVAGEYYVNLASQIVIFAVFAASINLLLGYGGLPTLGHAAHTEIGNSYRLLRLYELADPQHRAAYELGLLADPTGVAPAIIQCNLAELHLDAVVGVAVGADPPRRHARGRRAVDLWVDEKAQDVPVDWIAEQVNDAAA